MGLVEVGGFLEDGGNWEVLTSKALATLFPKLLCKGNSPGL